MTALLAMALGLFVPAVLATLSGRRPRLLLVVTAYPMIGAALAAVTHLVYLYGADHNHDVRTAALVVMVWLVVGAAFGTVFRLARIGRYRQAARRSIQVGLVLLLVVLPLGGIISSTAFGDGGNPGPPSNVAGGVTVELAVICALTGLLIAPIALLRGIRAAQLPRTIHEATHSGTNEEMNS